MDVDRSLAFAGAYIATYALHSTLLSALALWVARRSGAHAPIAVERLLRTALLGGVFTAALAFVPGFEPLGGRFEFGTGAPETLPVRTAQRDAAFETPAPELTATQLLDVSQAVGEVESALLPLVHAPAVGERDFAREASSAPALAWPRDGFAALVALWGLGVAFGVAGALRDAFALRRALRYRLELCGGPLRRALDELCAAAGVRRRVRLSIAPFTHVPLSFGCVRPEIALPPRALEDLGQDEARAVLAHELAHVVRRDVAWLWLARGLGIVYWFQPFNRALARELERRAEFAADRWARGRLGSGESLAGALAEIAGWLVHERRALPAAPMARERSQLVRRVEELLYGGAHEAAEPRSLSAVAPLACVVVAAWAPAFGSVMASVSPDAASVDPEDVFERAPGPEAFERAVADESEARDECLSAEDVSGEVFPADAWDEAAFVEDPASPREMFQVAAASLDEAIAALEDELDELEDEFAAGEPDPELEEKLGLLQVRVDRLVERRTRLRELFLTVTEALDAASAASPEDTAPSSPSMETAR